MNDSPVKAARAGGRGARRAMRAAPDFEMLPSLKRGLPECEPMTPEQVERIDNASMAILEEVGVIFRDEIAPRFQKAGVRRTLYASKNDGALRASYLIHKLAPRLGDAINHVRNLAVEAIDAQLTDTSLLAHSYYGDQPLVIADIQAVLSGKSPSERNLVRLYDNSWSFKMAGARDWTWILIGVAFAAGFLIGIGLTRSRKQPS